MAPTSLPTLGCMIGPTSLHTLGCMMGHLTHKLMSCTMAMRCDAMRCHMPCHAIDAMRKQAEEKEAAVKVKRVGQLAAMAVRRLGRAGLTRGFNGCVDGRSSTCTCTCTCTCACMEHDCCTPIPTFWYLHLRPTGPHMNWYQVGGAA